MSKSVVLSSACYEVLDKLQEDYRLPTGKKLTFPLIVSVCLNWFLSLNEEEFKKIIQEQNSDFKLVLDSYKLLPSFDIYRRSVNGVQFPDRDLEKENRLNNFKIIIQANPEFCGNWERRGFDITLKILPIIVTLAIIKFSKELESTTDNNFLSNELSAYKREYPALNSKMNL